MLTLTDEALDCPLLAPPLLESLLVLWGEEEAGEKQRR